MKRGEDMCPVHEPTPHIEYKHYVLQTWMKEVDQEVGGGEGREEKGIKRTLKTCYTHGRTLLQECTCYVPLTFTKKKEKS